MNAEELAKTWREKHGYIGKGGVIVIFDGVVNSWVNELRNPEHWLPGCLAIDEDGNQWIAKGGGKRKGAESWQKLH